MILLRHPTLALCSDRSQKPKEHPTSGPPESWLNTERLGALGLEAFAFDFFVNWSSETISCELWIKRLVDESIAAPKVDDVPSGIYNCDGKPRIERLCGFAAAFGFTVHYFTFRDHTDWQYQPRPIVETVFRSDGAIASNNTVTIDDVRKRIQLLSGGPVRVGAKGLIYGLTSLECFLSHTDAAWPGDADFVLVDETLTPKGIVEFKKHTLALPISEQTLGNYYPQTDRRKYDRLAILAKQLGRGSQLPLVVLYYPTQPAIPEIKLEKLGGEIGTLKSMGSKILRLPTPADPSSANTLAAELAAMIRNTVI